MNQIQLVLLGQKQLGKKYFLLETPITLYLLVNQTAGLNHKKQNLEGFKLCIMMFSILQITPLIVKLTEGIRIYPLQIADRFQKGDSLFLIHSLLSH